ncbi:MAG: hypothetical protein V4515_14275, partial [Chloroflexota bacterium]
MTRKDPVTPELREAVLRRDGMCLLAKVDPGHSCRDTWGVPHAPTDLWRLSLEHVKSELRMGRRAPSDLEHLVAMCHSGNVGVPSKTQRAAIREYLEGRS